MAEAPAAAGVLWLDGRQARCGRADPVLSGGIDPATPPVHAATVAQQLTHARDLVAPHVGHGVSLQGCAPELIERFVKRADAASIDGQCLKAIPRPLFFLPLVEVRRDRDTEIVP